VEEENRNGDLSTYYLEAIRQGIWKKWTATQLSSALAKDIGIYAALLKSTTVSSTDSAPACHDTPIAESASLARLSERRHRMLLSRVPVYGFIGCAFNQISKVAKTHYLLGRARAAGPPALAADTSRRPVHSQNPEMWLSKSRTESHLPATPYDAKG